MGDNKKLIIVISVTLILLLLFGSYYFLNSKKSGDVMMKETPKTMVDSSPESMVKDDGSEKMMQDEKNDGVMMKDDNKKYIKYSDASSLKSDSNKIVLFFYANWCPTCIPTDKEFSDNLGKMPEGVTVVRVNYNDNETDKNEKALADKYGITYQHTFVQIDKDGGVVTKWNGGGLSTLIANIK